MPEAANNREVNADTEVLNIANGPDEGDDDLDETVIPAVEEDAEEGEPEDPEADTVEENIDADTPASSPEGAQPVAQKPVPAPSKQPAPVPGETPKETALRLEVQRVKKLLRKEGIQDIVGNKQPAQPPAVVDRLAKLRETYSDEEIKNMEEAVDVIAASKGYVKADQNYQQTVDDLVESFVEANPEYKPQNDPEDVRWNRFEEILKSGIYNVTGKTPKQLRGIFDRVHKDVVEELGEPTVKTQVKQEAAQRQKIKSVSHSGGSKPVSVASKKTIDPSVRSMFKGFDDNDFDE